MSLVSRIFLSAPGVQSVFFVAPRWAPRPFGGTLGQAPFCSCPVSLVSRIFFAVGPGCDFFLCCAPLGAGTFRRGQSKKKHHPWVVLFFCSGPVPAPNGASPSPAFRRGRSKKKLGGVFLLLWPAAPNGAQQRKKHFAHPGPTAKKILETNDTGHEQKGATTKKNTLAQSPAERSRRPTRRNQKQNTLHNRGRQQKQFKKPMTRGTSKKGPPNSKKNLARPRADAHSLTAGLGGDASRRGGVFYFAAAPPGPGWWFFFAVAPPGRSLTHCGLERFRQGPGGVFFFGCGRAEPGEPITKNVWCTTSGLKRPGGATAKTKTPLLPKS